MQIEQTKKTSYKISIYDIVFQLKCYIVHASDRFGAMFFFSPTSFFKNGTERGLCMCACIFIFFPFNSFYLFRCWLFVCQKLHIKILCVCVCEWLFLLLSFLLHARSCLIQTRKCYPCIIRLTKSFEWFRCVCVSLWNWLCGGMCMNAIELQLKPHYNNIRASVCMCGVLLIAIHRFAGLTHQPPHSSLLHTFRSRSHSHLIVIYCTFCSEIKYKKRQSHFLGNSL